jgi:hypothetical protein
VPSAAPRCQVPLQFANGGAPAALRRAAQGDNAWLFINEESISESVKAYLTFENKLREKLPKEERAEARPIDVSGAWRWRRAGGPCRGARSPHLAQASACTLYGSRGCVCNRRVQMFKNGGLEGLHRNFLAWRFWGVRGGRSPS